jgi:protein-L-isoaspartate(D-aspartate) O-methyltransferase
MDFNQQRQQLVNLLSKEIQDNRVLEAMSRIPRERFIPDRYSDLAYSNEPLPIGYGQTISQPLMIALMTEALKLNGSEKILEIGTGSGYQAAILAELGREVISVERIPELAESARKTLSEIGYNNVRVFEAAPTFGWEAEAPYDRIIVTAGAPEVPQSLLQQLDVNGIMVIPVGSRFSQDLYQIIKQEDRTVTNILGGCRFVPLIGKDAWNE